MTGNLDIVTRMFNTNSNEICNKTKVDKGFILFTGELNSVPYLIIDILVRKLIKTGNCKVINLYYKIDSFSSSIIESSVYSSIMDSSSETHSLQDLVDEGFKNYN